MNRGSIEKKGFLIFAVFLFLSSVILHGCTRDSHVVEEERVVRETPETGTTQTTTYTERETIDSDAGDVSVLGTVFNVIGEVIALPFRIVAGVFRFIF